MLDTTTLGRCLRQLDGVHVKPTTVLFLLVGQQEWMNAEQMSDLIANSHSIDLHWDAYIVDDHQEEVRGIYLFGPDGRAYRAFVLSR
jgi:hypothetical protein